jgi:hypothetical protein
MKSKDEVGNRYGTLTVIEIAPKQSRFTYWICKCDCGRTSVVRGSHLRLGHTKSCRCAHGTNVHGHARADKETPTYRTWMAMRERCYRKSNNKFHLYGARGIQVCARWFDFANFLSDMGERPMGKTLDRINGDLHYMPSNCRWAMSDQQASNRRKRCPRN